jgi:hypothetical protein
VVPKVILACGDFEPFCIGCPYYDDGLCEAPVGHPDTRPGSPITIVLRGCDDNTVLYARVSDEIRLALVALGAQSYENSKHNCQPTLTVFEGFFSLDELAYDYDTRQHKISDETRSKRGIESQENNRD